MIKVLLFAELQERIGKDQIELAQEQTTVAKLKAELKDRFQLTDLEQVMTAINDEYALDNDMVKAGDTVVFIPPVSGG